MDRIKPDTLRNIAFFEGLDDQAFGALSALCYHKLFESGELIIGHYDESFDVLFLLTGHARVNIYSSNGQRVSFREIAPGAIFGELSAIDGLLRSASVESVGQCSVAGMPQKVFLRALCDHPEFMMSVMKHLTQQIRRLTARVFEFSTLAVRNRVHAEILRIADAQESDNQAILFPQPTHEEIASRISTHREAVTRELSRLEEKGLILKQGRSLIVRNLSELRRLVEQGGED
jgi:CRP-like cAMP-binding protein